MMEDQIVQKENSWIWYIGCLLKIPFKRTLTWQFNGDTNIIVSKLFASEKLTGLPSLSVLTALTVFPGLGPALVALPALTPLPILAPVLVAPLTAAFDPLCVPLTAMHALRVPLMALTALPVLARVLAARRTAALSALPMHLMAPTALPALAAAPPVPTNVFSCGIVNEALFGSLPVVWH